MRAFFNGSLTGNWPPPSENVTLADCTLALEFSHRPEEQPAGPPNIEIAEFITNHPHLRTLPLFASHSIAVALHEIGSPLVPEEEFAGPSAHDYHENTGTFGELEQGLGMMAVRGLFRPALVTNRYNEGNAYYQATRKLKMNGVVVPDGLPGSFDPDSDQAWTQSLRNWRMLTYPRLVRIRLGGH